MYLNLRINEIRRITMILKLNKVKWKLDLIIWKGKIHLSSLNFELRIYFIPKLLDATYLIYELINFGHI